MAPADLVTLNLPGLPALSPAAGAALWPPLAAVGLEADGLVAFIIADLVACFAARLVPTRLAAIEPATAALVPPVAAAVPTFVAVVAARIIRVR